MRLVNPQDQIRFIGGITTSRTELVDLIKAWLAISLAFGIFLSGSLFSFDIIFFIIASLTVGLGFVAHEMAHKVLAQKYGCKAEFRSWDKMLILAVIMTIFLKVIIIAPGAVMISGPVGRRRNGKISAAGAIANLIVATGFLSLALIPVTGTLFFIAQLGFTINIILALFNMIPFWLFDGKKVLAWNKAVYFVMLGVGIGFMIYGIKNGYFILKI